MTDNYVYRSNRESFSVNEFSLQGAMFPYPFLIFFNQSLNFFLCQTYAKYKGKQVCNFEKLSISWGKVIHGLV